MINDKYEFRFSTNPADSGYDGEKSNWRAQKPDAVGTINTILQRANAALASAGCSGNGTLYVSEFRHKKQARLCRDSGLRSSITRRRPYDSNLPDGAISSHELAGNRQKRQQLHCLCDHIHHRHVYNFGNTGQAQIIL